MSGLTNGTAYTFKVSATNSLGTGPVSASSNAVTPAVVPGAPTAVTAATAGPGSVMVSWSAPASSSTITSYTVTPFAGTTAGTPVTVSGSPPATSTTVSGLTNGTTYTFKVSATSSVGTGLASGASNPATPQSSLTCPCNVFGTQTPGTVDSGDGLAVNLGMAFTTDTNGYITGARFYKATANTGTHVGSLWSASGTLLAQATFTNETASGWQQVSFSSPVAVTAGTTYVVSYLAPKGHYAATANGLTNQVNAAPLYALATANASNGNGVYSYASTSTFPVNAYQATNYWVDPVFNPTSVSPPAAPTGVTATAGNASATVSWTAPPGTVTSYTVTPFVGTTAGTPVTVNGSPPTTSTTVSGLTNGTAYTFKVSATNSLGTGPASAASNTVTPAAGSVPGTPTAVTAATAGPGSVTVSWSAPGSSSAITSYTVTPFVGTTAGTPVTVSGSPPATSTTVSGLTNGTTYTFKVSATSSIGTGSASGASNSATPESSLNCPCNIFGTQTPGTVDAGDGAAVNLGMAFTSDTNGFITGARFYKATANTGTHVGSLWSASGTLLAQATFTNETASGWQQVTFSSAVAVTAGTTYVVSYYAPNGHYSLGTTGFTNQVNAAPLYGLATANAPNGNGVFVYGSTSTFPTGTFNASNYFVDPVLSTTAPPAAPGAPTAVTAATAGPGSVTVSWSAPGSSSTITSYTVTPFVGTTAGTPVTVSGSPPATSTTLSGLTNGTTYTFKVSATSAVGTGLASGASNPATPESSLTCPCNVFGTQTPGTVDAGDGLAVNLGMAFTSDTNGFITGARFYKAAANTGTHVGSLWSASGTLLAQATFTNETASGWQQVTFSSAVAVTAGTTYVVSYYAPNGHYAATANGFSNQVNAAPLYGLATASTPNGNGVYSYASTSTFPVNTFQSTNYWVDPVFSTTAS